VPGRDDRPTALNAARTTMRTAAPAATRMTRCITRSLMSVRTATVPAMPMLTTPGPPPSAEGSADDRRPTLNKEAFDCPRCGTYAQQYWSSANIGEGTHTKGQGFESDWREARCSHCKKPSVWRKDRMVYPRAQLGGKPHADMPDEVRDLYEEAAAVAAVSRRAGAALARATVERLIKHLDPGASAGANLAARIERIKQRGVSTPVGEMLDVVRATANELLHEKDEPGELVVLTLDDEEGPQLVELFLEVTNDLVDELITKPATTRGLWDKLSPGIKAKLQHTPATSSGSADS
jgi:hypothetical protein